jgi:pimeloyl-ACP methyl ester carboxylesterase
MSWQLQLHRFKYAQAIGLPGHPEGLGLKTIGEYTASVEAYLEKNSIEDPILVGHSMGGAIAIEYALHHSDLKGLVLVGTGARLRVDQGLMAKIMQDYHSASKSLAKMSVSPSCSQVLVDRIVREILRVRAQVTYGDFDACNVFDRMNDVERIVTRTLIVCGEDDQLTPPTYSRYLHQKMRNSELHIIAGAGHSVMLEKHREFNMVLEAFSASL